MWLGDLDQALVDANAALSLLPHEASYGLRADVYWARGDLEKADADYSYALRLCPDEPRLLQKRTSLRQARTLGATPAETKNPIPPEDQGLADIPKLAQLLSMQVGERMKANPEALQFGISYPPMMLESVMKRTADPSFTPSTHVCDDMLSPSLPVAFDFAIQMRRVMAGQNIDDVFDEVQGYIDATALYGAVTAALAAGVRPGDALRMWPFFNRLQEDQKTSAWRFLETNGQWAMQTMQARDVIDGGDFMNRLVERVGATPADDAYRRGVRTARDTLIVYTGLLMAVLQAAASQPQ
jgi:tetratricopeptide (TPR) repeat protein